MSVKPIKPKGYDVNKLERAIRKEKDSIARDAKRELDKTTRTWTGDKPRFKSETIDKGDDMITIIDPEGTPHAIQKWSWMNEGVPPHPIRATGPTGRLWFGRTDLGGAYVPKTKPGELASYVGMGVDDASDLHAPADVIHPGIEAREWIELVTRIIAKVIGKREAQYLRLLAGGTYSKPL